MLETEDRPTGPDPTSRRRSPGRWLLVAAAAAVVAVGGTLLVAAGGDDENDQVDPATSTPTTAPAQDIMELEGFSALEPGLYSVDPDGDDTTPLRVTYQVAAEGWRPVVRRGRSSTDDDGHTVVEHHHGDEPGHATPVSGRHPARPARGPDRRRPRDRADPARAVRGDRTADRRDALRLPGKHLELTVPDLPVTGAGSLRQFADCLDGNLHSWIAPNNGVSFYGYTGEPGETEEFWILDVEGTRLVLVEEPCPFVAGSGHRRAGRHLRHDPHRSLTPQRSIASDAAGNAERSLLV